MKTFIFTSLFIGIALLGIGLYELTPNGWIFFRYDNIYSFLRFMGMLISLGSLYYFYRNRRDVFIVASIASAFFFNPFCKYAIRERGPIDCALAFVLILNSGLCYYLERKHCK